MPKPKQVRRCPSPPQEDEERENEKEPSARERARTWGWGWGLQEEVGQVKLKRIGEPFDVFAQEIESGCLWGQWLMIGTQLATTTSIDKFDGVLCRSGEGRARTRRDSA